MWRKKRLFGAVIAVLVIAAIALALDLHLRPRPAAGRYEVLRIGVLPSAGHEELQAQYAPLLAHLSRETGLKFQLITAESYEELLQRFGERQVELAAFGGFTFIQAQAFFGAVPLVMRDIDRRATAYAVVKAGGPLQDCYNFKCAGLKEARLLFGPKLSTSGHLMPLYFLTAVQGLDPEKDFREMRHASGHRAAVQEIRKGGAEVGLVHGPIYRTMLRQGELKPGELQVIWETPPFPDAVWAVPGDIDEAIKTKLRDAFLALDAGDETGAQVLKALGAGSYLPAAPADFAILTEVAESMGLMTREAP
ncbi:MAG: phosphate/phosphite/phosphonate ABC transporter substrate-binding protein [Rhodospirillaceae bacterium]